MGKFVDASLLMELNQSVKGTPDYTKYRYEYYHKNDRGAWVFSCWSTPSGILTVKRVMGTVYLIDETRWSRYKLDDEAVRLLGLEE